MLQDEAILDVKSRQTVQLLAGRRLKLPLQRYCLQGTRRRFPSFYFIFSTERTHRSGKPSVLWPPHRCCSTSPHTPRQLAPGPCCERWPCSDCCCLVQASQAPCPLLMLQFSPSIPQICPPGKALTYLRHSTSCQSTRAGDRHSSSTWTTFLVCRDLTPLLHWP